MDILRVESAEMKNLLSWVAEKSLRKAVGGSVKDFEIDRLDVTQEDGEISFDLHVSGKVHYIDVADLLNKLV